MIAEGELEDKFGEENGKEKYSTTGFMKTGVVKMTIPVSIIYPGQPGLQSDNLLKVLNFDKYTTLPEAVKVPYNGRNYIVLIDGHHRVASQILKGNDRVELILKNDNY